MTGLLFLALVTCAQYVRYAKLGILYPDEENENERTAMRVFARVSLSSPLDNSHVADVPTRHPHVPQVIRMALDVSVPGLPAPASHGVQSPVPLAI